MIAKRMEHFEKLLLQERARVNALLERIAVAAPKGGTDGHAPGDETDAGVAGVGPDDDAAIIAGETASLREIDDALRVLWQSPHDYGICAQCGRPIPDERLELMPATRFCGRTPAGIRR